MAKASKNNKKTNNNPASDTMDIKLNASTKKKANINSDRIGADR